MIFTADDGKTFFKKTSADFLSEANSDVPVSNLAELVSEFNKKAYANKIVKYDFRRVDFDPTYPEKIEWSTRPNRSGYFVCRGSGIFSEVTVGLATSSHTGIDGKIEQHVDGYTFISDYCGRTNITISGESGELVKSTLDNHYEYYRAFARTQTRGLGYMQSQEFYDLYVVFENGVEKKLNTIWELTSNDYNIYK
jgi:hypothetical protein